MSWIMIGTQLSNTSFVNTPSEPFHGDSPAMMWRIMNGSPLISNMINRPLFGAFANATQLKRISIPKSVKYIGTEAFGNTQLTSVTIASDCTYFSTSFPDGCEVHFYPD